DSATLHPSPANWIASEAVSLGPLCDHVPPERAKAQTAPDEPSYGPPTSAVLPSPDSATLKPKSPNGVSSLAVSFGPWCDQTPAERGKAHSAPVSSLSYGVPTSAVFPPPESAISKPNEPVFTPP